MSEQGEEKLLIQEDCQLLPLPGGAVVKNPPANAGDVRDVGSIPESGRCPWRRAWQPTPVFLLGESHGERNLAGHSPQGRKESDTTEATEYACTMCYINKTESFKNSTDLH